MYQKTRVTTDTLRIFCVLFTLCAWLLVFVPARATSVVDTEEWSVGLDGVLKTSGAALHLHWPWPAVVGPTAFGGLGWTSRDAQYGAGDLRLKFSGKYKEDRFKWDIQVRTGFFLFTEPNMVSAFSGGVDSTAEPPRSLPMQYTDATSARRIWNAAFDRLFFHTRAGPADILIGRQPISLGVGFIWQPADLLAPFSPLDIDKEFKPGVDAVRVNLALGPFTEWSFIGVAGAPNCRLSSIPDASNPLAPAVWQTPDGKDCTPGSFRFSRDSSSMATRLRTTIGEFDIGVLAGHIRGDWVAGAFTTGTLGRFTVRSEATFTWDKDPHEPGHPDYSFRDWYVRAVAGLDYSFDFKRPLRLFSEFYYNGFGSRNPDDYPDILQSGRIAQYSEMANPGQFYLGLGVSWELAEKVKFGALALGNLTDPSGHFSTSLEILLTDESVLQIGGFLPLGRRPEILYVNQIPTGFALHGEFGMYPTMVFALYKRYF